MVETIIQHLVQRGFRITTTRRALITIFHRKTQPLSAMELGLILKGDYNLKVNKTTIYRELEFLIDQNIIQPINFNDRLARYELRDQPHHHHVICTECHRIEEIHMDHKLNKLETILEKKTRFKINHHSLEFFGLCFECEQKS